MKIIKRILKESRISIFLMVLTTTGLYAQNPTYLCELRNDVQINASTYEFDVYLLRTGSTVFEFTSMQFGININPLVLNGGNLAVTLVSGTSELNPSQIPTAIKFSFSALNNCIIMTGMAPPGAGSGTIISNTGNGTRVGRIRLTNTVNFASDTPDLAWSFSLANGYITKVNAYVAGIATDITVQPSHTTSNLTNPIFNPPPTAPIVGTITQPTCASSTGSVVLSGLPSVGTWTLTSTPGGITTTGTGVTTTISGLSTGTYTFTVTNSAGSTSPSSSNVVINSQPVTPTAPSVGTITQPTCATSTGSVDLSSLPSSGTWTLTRTPGGTTTTGTGTSTTISGLAAGTYTYTVTNSAGCVSIASGNVAINAQPATPSAPTVGTITQPTCATSTGSVVLNSLPSSGTWTLTRTPGGTTTTGTGTSTTISGLSAGTYTYTVSNASGCTSTASGNVAINAQPVTPTAPSVGSIVQPTCATPTGSVDLSGLPSSGTWTLTRTPGGTTTTGTGTSTTISGLPVGTYTYTVSNASGCTSTSSGNVAINAQPATPSAPAVGTITQPTCATSTGSVVLNSLPSSGTWTLTRTPGGTTTTGTGTTTTISGLASGNYTYTVTNASGCTSSSSGNVAINAQPATPTAPIVGTITQPTCGSSTGSVALSGLPSGSWTINPGGIIGSTTSTTISNLTANTYNFTVTNSSGCTSPSTGNVVINAAPGSPSAPLVGTITQPTCASSTGSVVLSGLPSGNWTINPGGILGSTTSTTISNLSANTYNFTVTNASGCTSPATGNVVINAQPATPVAPIVGTITQPTCAVATGSVVLSGLPSGSWTINPGGINGSTTSTTISNLTANTYNFTITNSSGCTSPATGNVVINAQPSTPTTPVVGTITQPTCALATGSVLLSGLPLGNWTINPGGIAGSASSATISGLAANTYNFTVTNSLGCTSPASGNVIINAQPVTPSLPAQNYTATPGSQFIYTPTGGTIPAGTTYTWPAPSYTGGVTGGAASIGSQLTIIATLNIPSGTGTAIYTVTPTSLAGCIGATFTVTVNVTSLCVPVTMATQPGNSSICSTSGIASFTVVPTGTGPFTYQWQYFNGISWANVVNGTPAGAVYSNPTTATMSVAGITIAGSHQYRCYVTNCSGGNFINSNAATLSVIGLPIPTLLSSDLNNIFCVGTSVTFTAGGGGVGATYDFRVQGFTVQTGTSTTFTTTSLANGQVVTVNVTNSTGCSALSAGITNSVNQPPFIYVSTPATCSADFTTYSVGVTVGSGTVTSSSGIVAPAGLNVWTVSGILAGINATITVADINGCLNTLTVTAPNCSCPVILAPVSGGDRSYCASGVIPTINATVLAGETVDWYNASSGGILLRSGSLTYTPPAPGTYYALARNTTSNCLSSTRTPIIVTMNPLPIPVLTSSDADNIFCAGTSVIFTASGGINYNFMVGGISIQNSASATYTNSTLTNGQTVSVIVTNSNGCTATSAAITNTVNPTPTPTLTSSDADNIFCAGTSIIFTAGGGSTYDFRIGGISQQNGALTTYTTSLLTNGQVVNVVVSNANGCSATSPSITNTVNPIPTPTLTSSDADNIFCAGTSVIFTAGGGTNYNFRVGGVSVQNSTSNVYTTTSLTNGQVVNVIVSNSVGCALASTGITNTVNPQPTANAGAGGDVCGLSFNLSAHASIGIGTWTKTTGTGTATFTPDAGSPNATVTVSEYGTYTFTWTEVSGSCSNSSVVTVNFYLQPVANAGTGGNNCGMGFRFNATLNAGIGTWTKVSGPGTVIFSPDVNSANALVTVSAFGSYTFRWTVDNGTCSNSATVAVVFIQQAAANAGLGGNSCDRTFTLGALVPATGTSTWTKSVGPGNATFAPDNHNAGAKVTVDQFGAYTFAWTVVNSTCTSSDIVHVVFHNLPPINAGRDTALCKGGSIQLHAIGTGTVSWTPVTQVNNPNIINPTVSPDTTTTFTVNLTDQFGCKNSDNIVVEVRNKIVADAGPDQVLGYVFTTTMDANLNHSYETGVWSLISGTGEFSDSTFAKTEVNSLSSGENKFLWTVKNGYCPVSQDSVSIKVNDFIIPSLITPNMDGKNDYFVLRGLTTTLGKTELIIFDRRGAMVYKNLNYDNSWNGVDYNKNPLPDDTYFYVIKTSNGKSISGYIVIRR